MRKTQPRIAACFLFLASTVTAHAEQSICPHMPKPMQAKCYADDKKPKLTSDQRGLIESIKQIMLKAGVRVQVYGVPSHDTAGRAEFKYPALEFHGYGLDRVAIHQIETRVVNTLDAAHKAGFKTVRYMDLIPSGDGVYVFNVEAPGKACSRSLCFN